MHRYPRIAGATALATALCLPRLLAAQDTTRAPIDTVRDGASPKSSPAAAVTPAKKPPPARPPKPKPEWPVKGPPALPGSILPDRRIVAFYGNPLSKRMGILGALPPERMLAKLDTVVQSWRLADSLTPVQPALHLIAVVAQGSAGRDGKYRARMADTLIDRVLSWAQTRNAIVFLDLQVGKSTLQDELPRLSKYLSLPNVHLGIDPEFSMKRGGRPGERVGTYDATDINWASQYLAELVTQHNLPPKVFVIHRFTRPMVTNSKKIRLDPRVQIVMHMDGWGWPSLKKESYRRYIYEEPVQFTGFKLFYRNDTKTGTPLMTPAEILKLEPKPLYIQYQ
ncbi:MAG TPA: hypothetical protein VFU01_13075 [Gemmatimonadaceae bacterium]|nr:hypothetical protein [Gemmatimonadaceae bacterium]